MHALNPPILSYLTTINETRDLHIPHLNLHSPPYNPTLIQMCMHKTDYQFQISALNYTKDHLHSRATEEIHPYEF